MLFVVVHIFNYCLLFAVEVNIIAFHLLYPVCHLISVEIFSQVDPIVASFSGGAVGVISALMVVEINNVKQQEQKRCKYCLGAGMTKISLVIWILGVEFSIGRIECSCVSFLGLLSLNVHCYYFSTAKVVKQNLYSLLQSNEAG